VTLRAGSLVQGRALLRHTHIVHDLSRSSTDLSGRAGSPIFSHRCHFLLFDTETYQCELNQDPENAIRTVPRLNTRLETLTGSTTYRRLSDKSLRGPYCDVLEELDVYQIARSRNSHRSPHSESRLRMFCTAYPVWIYHCDSLTDLRTSI
jgi:hypothetical protein